MSVSGRPGKEKVACIHNGIHEYLSFAPTLMNLEIVMLSEISQAQKDKHSKVCIICVAVGSKKVNLKEVENGIMVT
jgi:hypothetical protein